jgi:hypothetical protein
VTRHFFVRTFAIAPQDLYKLKLDAVLSCNCSSSIIVASDQEERGVGRPAGRSDNSVHQPSASTPCLFSIMHLCQVFGGAERKPEC